MKHTFLSFFSKTIILLMLFGTYNLVHANWRTTVNSGETLTAVSWNAITATLSSLDDAITVSGSNIEISGSVKTTCVGNCF